MLCRLATTGEEYCAHAEAEGEKLVVERWYKKSFVKVGIKALDVSKYSGKGKHDRKIARASRVILIWLKAYKGKNKISFPSIQLLREHTGYSNEVISESIKLLCKEKLVAKQSVMLNNRGAGNTYNRYTFPKEKKQEEGPVIEVPTAILVSSSFSKLQKEFIIVHAAHTYRDRDVETEFFRGNYRFISPRVCISLGGLKTCIKSLKDVGLVEEQRNKLAYNRTYIGTSLALINVDAWRREKEKIARDKRDEDIRRRSVNNTGE